MDQEKPPPSQQSPETSELYTKVLSIEQFPQPELQQGITEMPLRIIGDTTVELYGMTIPVTGTTLYALNCLLLTRDLRSVDQLAMLGFNPNDDISALTSAIRSLGTQFKQAAGTDVVIKWRPSQGRNHFCFLPQVVAIDDRLPDEPYLKRSSAKPRPKKEKSEYMKRARNITAIVSTYADHPQVTQQLEEYRRSNAKNTPKSQIDRSFPILTFEQEQTLFATIEQGLLDTASVEDLVNLTLAHQIMLLSNRRLVASIALRYLNPTQLSADDLIQEGLIGLMCAVARFDHTKGYKFSTYATHWIRQAIQRGIEAKGFAIRVPHNVQTSWVKAAKAVQGFEATHFRPPTVDELVEITGFTLEEARRYLERDNLLPVSLDQPTKLFRDKSETTVGDMLQNQNPKPCVDEAALHARKTILRLFDHPHLTVEEKLVLGLRHGVTDLLPQDFLSAHASQVSANGITEEEIGKLLGKSVRNIQTIAASGLAKSLQIVNQE